MNPDTENTITHISNALYTLNIVLDVVIIIKSHPRQTI